MPRIPYQMPGLRNGTAPMQHHRSSMVTGDEARRQRGRRGRVPVATSTQVERKRATAASRAAPPWSAEMLSARTPSASSCLAREAHVKPLGPCYGAQVADTTKWGRPPARATPAKQRRTRMRAARRRGAAAGAAPRRPRRRAGRARWPSPARRQASFRAVPGAPTSMLRRCPAQARAWAAPPGPARARRPPASLPARLRILDKPYTVSPLGPGRPRAPEQRGRALLRRDEHEHGRRQAAGQQLAQREPAPGLAAHVHQALRDAGRCAAARADRDAHRRRQQAARQLLGCLRQRGREESGHLRARRAASGATQPYCLTLPRRREESSHVRARGAGSGATQP